MQQLGNRAFFSFSMLTDQSKHWAYGEWHGLDHQPENVALAGVQLGRRWVKSPRCAMLHTAPANEMDAVQYISTYWFADPTECSIKEWDDFASMSRHWGRRPELAWTKRVSRGYFVPTKGYAAPTSLVSAEVIPYRPDRGVYVTLTDYNGPPVDVVEAMRFYDEELVHDLLSVEGVAGAWRFVSDDTFVQDRKSPNMSSRVLTLLYMDGDPVETSGRINELLQRRRESNRLPDESAIATDRIRGPLETVRPWEWTWFDDSDDGGPA